MATEIEAIIFDLDGVIIDSNPQIERFWLEWANKEGFTISKAEIRDAIHGRKGVETIELLFHASSNNIKQAIIDSAKVFDRNMQPSLIKGIDKLVQQINLLGIPTGIVTSSHFSRMKKMLDLHKLFEPFAFFITAEDVEKGKPDPEPYRKMQEKLQAPANLCLVFEDAISGIQSAKGAGMQVIGILGEHTVPNDLLQHGAAGVVNHYQNIVLNHSNLAITDDLIFAVKPSV